MRTTLTIDDDLAGLLNRRARELGRPFKEIVNAALRRGLVETSADSNSPQVTVRPHDFGRTRSGIDTDRFNQLLDELETEDFLRKSTAHDSA